MTVVMYAVVPRPGGAGTLRPLAEDGAPAGPAEPVTDLAAAVAERERSGSPRWVWPDASEVYPDLLRSGVRVDRCHDLALTEALLTGYAGDWGVPRGLAAALARCRDWPVPADPPPRPVDRHAQPALFEPDPPALPGGVDPLDAVVEVHQSQLRRIAAGDAPARMRLLVAAESAGALVAAEMGDYGLPWRADVHDALLTELLGARSVSGGQPARLVELAGRIDAAFRGRRVNPDSPADLIRAFGREGIQVPSTRSFVLREVNHPAVPLLLEYKELARLHVAHGWSWLDTWVADGRFRPEYVAGGVVSGRWASRGGGALQIPKGVRKAVVADPGWTLVVADAAQLEPRVLAALSGDVALAEFTRADDMYTDLAAATFGGDRRRAKIAMLAAMYGGTGGEAGVLLGTLRRRFPVAVGYVEQAARAGEEGRLVRSRLGRTCPPPSAAWWQVSAEGTLGDSDALPSGALPSGDGWGDADPAATGSRGEGDAPAAAERRAARAARSRGRFTRNFVVQATAAEWALALLAVLRQALAEPARQPAELVFFQHDEVIVHCAKERAEQVVEAVTGAAAEATRLVFGDTPVRFPLEVAVVECYADAK